VRLSPLGTSATIVSAPGDNDECGAAGGMRTGRGNRSTRRNPAPVPLFFFTGSTDPRRPWPLFQFHDHFTDGRTPWTSDQLVARTLRKYRTTQTQNKHIHAPNIHALCGIRTHDLSFRASETVHALRCPSTYESGSASRILSTFFLTKHKSASGIFSLVN
jgi:hypothetical protein